MEKKKILFVVHQLNCGGVQKSLITALDHLDYDKFDVTLYVRKNRIDLLNDVNKNVSVIINDDNHNYYRSLIGILLSLCIYFFSFIIPIKEYFERKQRDYIIKKQMNYESKKYFSSNTFDVSISYIQGYTALFVSKYISSEKKLMFFHGSEDEHHFLHESIIPTFNSVIGVSSDIESLLKEFYPSYAEKISYLDNFVDADYIKIQSTEYTVETKAEFIICSCGRFAEVKGFDIAVKAASLLKDKYGLSFLWYFVGDGPERTNIETLINQYSLNNNIIMTGMLNNPYPYINSCDIYVQPSRAEAKPLSLIEAQILNRPVVTTKTVGGMNIIKDGITGVQTEINAEALAEGILKLIDVNLRNNIVSELSKIDYSKEKERYKRQWAELLDS